MTVRTLTRTIGIAAVVWCAAALFPQEAAAQCGVSWSDTTVVAANVSTEALVEDYYDMPECGGSYGFFFEHGYFISIQMTCGTQYQEVSDATTQAYGGGSLHTEVNVTAIESTVCDINISLVILCSGIFYQPIYEAYEFQQPQVQLPYFFWPIGASQLIPNGCPTGSAGVAAWVVYQVLDENGDFMNQAGMTPQEHVTVNGVENFPGFRQFATPQTTDGSGQFNDKPVGTCFNLPLPPGAPSNPCVDVVQTFTIVPWQNVTFPIHSWTTRRDCLQGIRIITQSTGGSGSPGSPPPTQVFTFGIVN